MGCISSTTKAGEERVLDGEEQALNMTEDYECDDRYDREMIFFGYIRDVEKQLNVTNLSNKDITDLIASYFYVKWEQFHVG